MPDTTAINMADTLASVIYGAAGAATVAPTPPMDPNELRLRNAADLCCKMLTDIGRPAAVRLYTGTVADVLAAQLVPVTCTVERDGLIHYVAVDGDTQGDFYRREDVDALLNWLRGVLA